MRLKLCQYVLKVSRVPLKAALIVKQEMLGLGGEAALPREVAALSVETSDIILAGSGKVLLALADKLLAQPFGCKQVGRELQEAVANLAATGQKAKTWRSRDYLLPLGAKTYVMGILNFTPDSFSDGGSYQDPEMAVARAKEMVAHGAEVIDIGGESTRPGYEPVSEEEELQRVLPLINRLSAEISIPISIDTTKYLVAKESLQAGASIINDVSGLTAEPRLADLASQYGAGLIIMHTKSQPVYADLVGEVIAFLRNSVQTALGAGVDRSQIMIDPGIGFGKTLEHNLELLQHLDELKVLGYPILLGTSRKSVVGKVLGTDVNDRLEGTGATVALGIRSGADIVRVHDVKEMGRVARMADAIVRFPQSREG